MAPSKYLQNIFILCFERRFSKQNSVICLKSDILAPPKFFGLPQIFGLAAPLIKYLQTEGVLFLLLDYGSCILRLLATLLVITFPIFFCIL